ncbi:type II secretion system minor pseudopilin GspK [Sphingomonas arenae]|uniref:type II secretion system minor pseudopilin GspK n=1 Tax=Sphingomonas arenae TaxID=2812555 RepID=UPI0030139168
MIPRPLGPSRERGAALLTVFLLVAVMATVSATALDRLALATRLSGNVMEAGQARRWLGMAEELAVVRMEDMLASSPERTTLAGNWQDTPRTIELPDGARITARVRDGGNCFNLNSLAARTSEGQLIVRPAAVDQFRALMTTLGIDPTAATRISAAAADWIDHDSLPLPAGAEDREGHLVANRAMAHESELGKVPGMTPAIAIMLRPWICALPTHDASPLNVNTLTAEQAPLLAMLIPERLTVEQARAALRSRPASGFPNVEAFWNSPALKSAEASGEAASQVQVRTSFFRLEAWVSDGDDAVGETALLQFRDERVHVLRRDWSVVG